MTSERQIIDRFFEAIALLKRWRVIRGLQTITDKYGWNRWNLITLRDNPDEHLSMFRASWLVALHEDYKVSLDWLMKGEGSFFCTGFDQYIVAQIHGRDLKKVQEKCSVGRPRKNPVDTQRVTG